jgi:hypothetical protein
MLDRMSHILARRQRAITSAGRVIGLVVWLVFCWLNGIAIDYRSDAADASQAPDSSSKNSASSRSATLAHSSTQSTALSQAIYQNTLGNSQGAPLGLSWNVDTTSTPSSPTPPSGWSSLTGWAQVFQQAGASVSPNHASDTVQVQNFQTYVHIKGGGWVLAQNQATDGVSGANYIADFSNDTNIPFTTDQKNSDGSVTLNAPPPGYNDHFWPTGIYNFTPGAIDGVFVEAEMRTNDPSANLVAQLGADWWRNSTARWAGDNVNNIAVGINDWTKLTTQYQILYFTSLSAAQLSADPPPTLRTDSLITSTR